MTRSDALERADQCERMAQDTSDPHRQEVLRHMRQLWLTMAAHADQFQNIDSEFDRLIALQSAVQEILH
jgi:hypothetical protein